MAPGGRSGGSEKNIADLRLRRGRSRHRRDGHQGRKTSQGNGSKHLAALKGESGSRHCIHISRSRALRLTRRIRRGKGGFLRPGGGSVPIPKFARTRGTLRCELRNSKGHYQILVPVRILELKLLSGPAATPQELQIHRTSQADPQVK